MTSRFGTIQRERTIQMSPLGDGPHNHQAHKESGLWMDCVLCLRSRLHESERQRKSAAQTNENLRAELARYGAQITRWKSIVRAVRRVVKTPRIDRDIDQDDPNLMATEAH